MSNSDNDNDNDNDGDNNNGGGNNTNNNKEMMECVALVLVIGIVLTVILVPMSLATVEYNEYGLAQRRTTKSVDTAHVYGSGRHLVGPDVKFVKYKADAHVERFDDMTVFSAGESNSSIGLNFLIDVDYTYFLKKDEVGLIHEEMPKSYADVIRSRTREAIKNEAIFVPLRDYFQNRMHIEERFRTAVQTRWDTNPSVHASLDQFNLGRIKIPEQVASKQLQSKIQNERNDREAFLQRAGVERELTRVEVNKIRQEEIYVLESAEAEANAMRSKAESLAMQIRADAQTNGTRYLMDATNIRSQEHVTSFTYIRTLTNRDKVTLDVNNLNPDNILPTRQIES